MEVSPRLGCVLRNQNGVVQLDIRDVMFGREIERRWNHLWIGFV